MTGIARARRLRCLTVDLLPLRSLLLALFFALGAAGAYVLSGRCGGEAGEELRRYLTGYLSLASSAALTGETVARTAVCFFRAPVLAFLLGFASLGVVALPLLLAGQGFVLSFSLFSFAQAAGREGFALLFALFAVRMLFVVPCTFLLAAEALDKSQSLALLSLGGGKRAKPVVYGSAYWYRFAVCCVLLATGCVLELWLTPQLLAAL